jgi:D-glycero-D-manno-heptose 1,7-bisphosphate phosphatase
VTTGSDVPSFRPSVVPSSRPCVFLDRDGTIVVDPGYLSDPGGVRLIPGAATAISQLNAAGYPVFLITNQAGISREKLTWDEYFHVTAEMQAQLARGGARLEAIYVCPHAPERDGPCPCRKPGLLHYEYAARDFEIDLRRSWYVGDRLSDLLAAPALGAPGRAFLVLTGHGAGEAAGAAEAGFESVADVAAAVERILAAAGAAAG